MFHSEPRRSYRRCAAYYLFLASLAMGASSPETLNAQCTSAFVRADVDANGAINLSDALQILDFLFEAEVLPCRSAADTDDSGDINVTDPIFLLDYLFIGSVPQLPPPAMCGNDPTPDDLGCNSFEICPDIKAEEICDGIDNDCDGKIDEGFDLINDPQNCGRCGRSCTDLDAPHVLRWSCEQGSCVVLECERGHYDADGIAENGCESLQPANGTPCDDGNPCTDHDQYFSGVCGGTPRDCSLTDTDCSIGVCDAISGECVPEPRPEGTPCDDGNPNTWADKCNGRGDCAGVPLRP